MRWSERSDAQIGLYHRVCTFIVCMQLNQIDFFFDGTSAICDDKLAICYSCKLTPNLVAT